MTFTEARKRCQRLLGADVKLWFGTMRDSGRPIVQEIDRWGWRSDVAVGENWFDTVERVKAVAQQRRARKEREKASRRDVRRIRADAAKLGRVSRALVLREAEAKCPGFAKLSWSRDPTDIEPYWMNRRGFVLTVEFPDTRYHSLGGEDWAEVLVRLRETDVDAVAVKPDMVITFGRAK